MSHDAKLLLLNRDDVESLIASRMVLDAVKEAFVLHSTGEGRSYPLIRERLKTGGIFGIKAGDVETQSLLGFKAAGFWPANREVGGEPHQATVCLIDPRTGRPLCILDGNTITTQRTGAAGGIGIEMLARSDSRSICVFGTGTQAKIQVSYALQVLREVESVTYLTSQGKSNKDFERALHDQCEVRHSEDPNRSVSMADVVITATPGRAPLFDSDSVQPGTHINAVGSDTKGKQEIPIQLLSRATLFVDDNGQSRQIGELQWGGPSLESTEVGLILAGKLSYQRRDNEITLFDMTGLALQDLTLARRLFDNAIELGVGARVAWEW